MNRDFDEPSEEEQLMFIKDQLGDMQPICCDKCGNVLHDGTGRRGDYTINCAANTCEIWRCAKCHTEWASVGPMGCRACNSYSMWENIRHVLWYVFVFPLWILKMRLRRAQ